MPSIIFFAARIEAPLVALIKKDGGFFYQGNERERRAESLVFGWFALRTGQKAARMKIFPGKNDPLFAFLFKNRTFLDGQRVFLSFSRSDVQPEKMSLNVLSKLPVYHGSAMSFGWGVKSIKSEIFCCVSGPVILKMFL